MIDKSIDTEKGTLYYSIKDDKATVTTYSGRDIKLVIPEQIEGLPVRKISKKAFLNSRQLRELVIPDTVRKISDWAFAHAANLEEVSFPRKNIKMGKGVFTGDEKLIRFTLRDRDGDEKFISLMTEKEKEDLGVLIALVAGMPGASYLLDFMEAGKEEWYRKVDSIIRETLDEPDEEGHTEMILCGEEDIDCTLESFIKEKRKKKSRLSLLRLIYDTGVSPSLLHDMKEYVLSHTLGCESDEAWEVLLTEKSHIKEYYTLFFEIGAVNDSNFDDILTATGDKAPEMKAFFLRKHKNDHEEESFFDKFQL